MIGNRQPAYVPNGEHRGAAAAGRQSLARGTYGGSARKQPVHILAACARCRQRKTKCDPLLPRCGPCEKSGAACHYWDASKEKMMPRSYVVDLQAQVRDLETELAGLRVHAEHAVPVHELVRGGGLVRIRKNAETRFLGPASGINMTKLVLELARSFAKTRTIQEIIPENFAEQLRKRFEEEYSKPTSKVYPLTSNIAAPTLPPLPVTYELVQVFMLKAQTFYPVLHEPTFRQQVEEVYAGDSDAYKNFTVRMVIALGMHKVDSRWAGLADSFYLAALQYLEGTVRPRNLGTLQCFALIAEYSITTPTRTASYWIVGLAAKLLQELRMTDEATIGCDEHGNPLDPLEVDMRRRLFFVCTNMELGLAHSLGRPSAFSVTSDHKDVKYYSEADDHHITRTGIVPGAVPTLKKQMSIHYNAMRWIQLEIRHTLYLNKRDEPTSDQDPWFYQVEEKAERWMREHPKPPDGNGFPEEWFRLRYNTIVVFIFRPSPQVPEPSMRAVRRCYDACVDNIQIHRNQLDTGSVDVTWVFAQQLFMIMNTVLWTLSYGELRSEHSRTEVQQALTMALGCIVVTSRKWPGVESALSLYMVLVDYCLQAYDGDAEASYGAASPMMHPALGPPSPQSVDTNPIINSPSTVYSAVTHASAISSQTANWSQDAASQAHDLGYATSDSLPVEPYGHTPGSNMTAPSPSFSQSSFDPSSFFNPLPSPQADLFSGIIQETAYMLNPLEQQYMPFMPMPQPEPMEGINSEEQSRLMEALEKYGLGTPPSMTSPRHNIVT